MSRFLSNLPILARGIPYGVDNRSSAKGIVDISVVIRVLYLQATSIACLDRCREKGFAERAARLSVEELPMLKHVSLHLP